MNHSYTLCIALALTSTALSAQYTPPDPSGFEGIIVEKYYVSDANDAADEDGSADLATGETTYRVFVDLQDGYKLLTMGGFPSHAITFNTTTSFFYNEDRGESWATDISDTHLEKNTVAIDSWLSMGGASDAHWGVPKADDTDGSVVGGANNDGGSNGVAGGLLVNAPAQIGVPLVQADGLFLGDAPPAAVSVGTVPTIFNEIGGAAFTSEDFAWAVLGGVEAPTPGNKILIGQFTTDGEFSFCLNLWVKIPDELVCEDVNCHEFLELYATLLPSDTAGTALSGDNKFTHATLCYSSASANEDCLGVPGGPALPGTPCDDGNPDTGADTWSDACTCTGVTGVDEASALAGLVSVHPNPTRDVLNLRLTGLTGQHVTYALRDLLGRTVLTHDLGIASGDRTDLLDLSSMAAGTYLLEFDVDGLTHTERVTKE